jgi:hypothetical protein
LPDLYAGIVNRHLFDYFKAVKPTREVHHKSDQSIFNKALQVAFFAPGFAAIVVRRREFLSHLDLSVKVRDSSVEIPFVKARR